MVYSHFSRQKPTKCCFHEKYYYVDNCKMLVIFMHFRTKALKFLM